MYLTQTGGRIVGLAYSYSDGYLFWSDISLSSRGIYRAATNSAGALTNVTRIVSDGQCRHASLVFSGAGQLNNKKTSLHMEVFKWKMQKKI